MLMKFAGNATKEQIDAGRVQPLGGPRHDYWRQASRAMGEYRRLAARYDDAFDRYGHAWRWLQDERDDCPRR